MELRRATAADADAIGRVHATSRTAAYVDLVPGSGADGTATLHAIHVVPALHGTGAGRLLHDALLADFVGWGCRRSELWVLDGNERAQAFYRRRGWHADGGRDRHVLGGVEVPILRYSRDLMSC